MMQAPYFVLTVVAVGSLICWAVRVLTHRLWVKRWAQQSKKLATANYSVGPIAGVAQAIYRIFRSVQNEGFQLDGPSYAEVKAAGEAAFALPVRLKGCLPTILQNVQDWESCPYFAALEPTLEAVRSHFKESNHSVLYVDLLDGLEIVLDEWLEDHHPFQTPLRQSLNAVIYHLDRGPRDETGCIYLLLVVDLFYQIIGTEDRRPPAPPLTF